VVDDGTLAAFYRTYPEDRRDVDVVVFSGPQLSVLELRRIAELLRGRRVHGHTALIVTTNFANREMAARLGYVKAIEDAGGRVLAGVCWYIMEPAKSLRLEERGHELSQARQHHRRVSPASDPAPDRGVRRGRRDRPPAGRGLFA